jgi:hypothetical protein
MPITAEISRTPVVWATPAARTAISQPWRLVSPGVASARKTSSAMPVHSDSSTTLNAS